MSPGGDSDENHYPIIPNDLITGEYYIIWHLDINDQNTNNNLVAARVFINGHEPIPDLIVSEANIQSSGGIIAPGSSLNVSAKIKNDGYASIGTSTLRYWISNDNALSADDRLLAEDQVGSLATQEISAYESATLSLPSDRLGSQFILFQISSNGGQESNTANNIVARGFTIEEPTVDLVIVRGGGSASPESSSSARVNWSASIRNNGNTDLNTFIPIEVYLSADPTLSTSQDHYLGEGGVNGIASYCPWRR